MLWKNIPNLDPKHYGRLNHWKNTTLRKIFKFYKVNSIAELLAKF